MFEGGGSQRGEAAAQAVQEFGAVRQVFEGGYVCGEVVEAFGDWRALGALRALGVWGVVECGGGLDGVALFGEVLMEDCFEGADIHAVAVGYAMPSVDFGLEVVELEQGVAGRGEVVINNTFADNEAPARPEKGVHGSQMVMEGGLEGVVGLMGEVISREMMEEIAKCDVVE